MANSYKNQKLNLTTNSATTLYTVPSGRTAILKSLTANEKSNNATTITVILYDGNPASGGNPFNIYTNKTVSAYETLELLYQPFIGQKLDKKKLQKTKKSIDILIKNAFVKNKLKNIT